MQNNSIPTSGDNENADKQYKSFFFFLELTHYTKV